MAPAGRPRTFDRDQALKKAMLVFWEKGYEGTTMSDLIETIGMKAPSVYAAFGNKDKLFIEAIELYSDLVKRGPLNALNESKDIFESIKNSLTANVELFKGSDKPSSCLIMTAAINCAPEHMHHVERLKDLRTRYKGALASRFKLAAADNQLISDADPISLAEFFTTFIHGMALRAKDGSSEKELQASCELALAALKPVLR